MAGVYTPTKGRIHINGSLVPFIELGVGFNPELSGRDNVYLNGALLGFNRKQMEAMYDDIVEFAELENFMDQKLKNYSSGMQVRLAFSIAIRAKGDILLLDEVLAVGDANFQRKCYDYFNELKKEKKTVILVSHSMGNITDFCDTALLLDSGQIVSKGDPDEIVAQYDLLNAPNSKSPDHGTSSKQPIAEITKVLLNGKNSGVFNTKTQLDLDIKFRVNQPTKVVTGMSIIRSDGSNAAYLNTEEQVGAVFCKPEDGEYELKLKIEPNQLGKGTYRLDVALYDEKKPRNYLAKTSSAINFAIINDSTSHGGVMNLKASWEVSSKKRQVAI